MSGIEQAMRRLEDARPCEGPENVEETAWSAGLRAFILAGRPPEPRPVTRPRRVGRRTLVIALVAALLVGAGAGLAAVVINQQAPEPVQRSVRSALDLPSAERAALQPVPGGIREAFRAETPYGTWVIYSIETRDKGTLITDGVLGPDGSLQPTVIAGCPALPSAPGSAVAYCSAGTSPLGPGTSPQLSIIGRVSPDISKVGLRLPDGAVVPAQIDRGFFLVLLRTDPGPGSLTLVARSSTGEPLASQTLRQAPGTGLPIPVPQSGP